MRIIVRHHQKMTKKELPIRLHENLVVGANVPKTQYVVLDDLARKLIRVDYKSLLKKSKPIHA